MPAHIEIPISLLDLHGLSFYKRARLSQHGGPFLLFCRGMGCMESVCFGPLFFLFDKKRVFFYGQVKEKKEVFLVNKNLLKLSDSLNYFELI